jgi:hypothetical protein
MGRSLPFRQRVPRALALLVGLGCGLGAALAGGCGRRGSAVPASEGRAILGGAADTTHDAVMAVLQLESDTRAFACSGTLIAQQGGSAFLLTAAHCVVPHDAMGRVVLPPVVVSPSVMIALPGPDWQVSLAQGRKLTVAAISVAPGYDGAADSPSDVAILRLQTSAPPPTVIPILEPAEDTLASGSLLTLVGFGETETDAQNSIRRAVDRSVDSLTSQQLRYLQNDMVGQCHGDSGGPAVVRVAGAERVAGVMSYGEEIPALNLSCRLQSGAVRISSLAAFVHGVIGVVGEADAGVSADAGAGGRDGAAIADGGVGTDAKPDAAPACGKVTDPRPACAACIMSRCCLEAAVCGADPLCLGCGASPLPSCQSYPPSATLTACLAGCPHNPCGVPVDAGAGQVADAGAEAAVDGSADAAPPAIDAAPVAEAGRDAGGGDAPGEAGEDHDASPSSEAGAGADAAMHPDASPSDAAVGGTTEGGVSSSSSGGGCAVSGTPPAPWSLWWVVWSGAAARNARRRLVRDRRPLVKCSR